MEFAPRVKVKRMKLATGDCVCLNAGDAVLVSDEENEILVFSTRRPDFSRCVRVYVHIPVLVCVQ